MQKAAFLAWVASSLFVVSAIGKEAAKPTSKPGAEKGTVHFQPVDDQKNIPERYRLEAHSFEYEMELMRALPNSGVEVFHHDHNPSVREKYSKAARELDLVATAGSDFHGEAVAPGRMFGIVTMEPEELARLEARRG